MSTVDRMRVQAVAKLDELGFVYTNFWHKPVAPRRDVITGCGYYHTSDGDGLVYIVTASDEMVDDIWVGYYTNLARDLAGELAWDPYAWRSDGTCLYSIPLSAENLRITKRCAPGHRYPHPVHHIVP